MGLQRLVLPEPRLAQAAEGVGRAPPVAELPRGGERLLQVGLGLQRLVLPEPRLAQAEESVRRALLISQPLSQPQRRLGEGDRHSKLVGILEGLTQREQATEQVGRGVGLARQPPVQQPPILERFQRGEAFQQVGFQRRVARDQGQ